MKISAEILSRNLKEKFIFDEYGTLSIDLVFDIPMFYKSNTATISSNLLIGYGDDFSSFDIFPQHSLLLSIGTTKEKCLSSNLTLLEFNKTTCPFELFNYINEIFDFYDDWKNSLDSILKNGNSVRDLLDCCLPIFNNPISIFTSEFNIFCYSSIVDTDTNFKNSLNKENFYNHEFCNEEKYIKIDLFDNEIVSYQLVLSSNIHPFYPSDKSLFNYLSKYIKLMLHNENIMPTTFNYTLEKILLNILNENLSNTFLIAQGLSLFNWFKNNTYCCMSVKMDSFKSKSLDSNFICNKIEGSLPNSCAFFFNNAIAIFINLTLFHGNINDIENIMVSILEDYSLKAGISNIFVGLNNLKYNYIQSCIALNTGIRNNPSESFYYFNEILPFYFIESTLKDLPVNLICSPNLLELKDYDDINGSDYFNTLRVYIENNLNAVKSANQLSIHRSTFIYRIDKIKNLVNIDFEDTHTFHYLYLSFKMLDFHDKTHSTETTF